MESIKKIILHSDNVNNSILNDLTDFFVVYSKDYRAKHFYSVYQKSSELVMVSSEFTKGDKSYPLKVMVHFRLISNQLFVNYEFEALETFDLEGSLNIGIFSTGFYSYQTENQYFTSEQYLFNIHTKTFYEYLNQEYNVSFMNNKLINNLKIIVPNPYHSFVTVRNWRNTVDTIDFHVLTEKEPKKAVSPEGPLITSRLKKGEILYRQFIIQLDDNITEKNDMIYSYFSPYPKGYEQVISMIFDELPFQRWCYPASSSDLSCPVQRYLIRLLEEFPKMKMGWIVITDPITRESSIANQDYEKGKWWKARSLHNIYDSAPDSFKQWLINLEQDNVVLGYEDRVHLGNHGLHHSSEPEGKWTDDFAKNNWEFQSYDPEYNDSAFARIAEETEKLGLTDKSLKYIRFPGHRFTLATIRSLIRHGYLLFDHPIGWGGCPLVLYYSEHGKIWGIPFLFDMDVPDTKEKADSILGHGKILEMGTHPGIIFQQNPYSNDNPDGEERYEQIAEIFRNGEDKYPNLGYMFPDEIGYFANELYEIRDFNVKKEGNVLSFLFKGKLSLEEQWF